MADNNTNNETPLREQLVSYLFKLKLKLIPQLLLFIFPEHL